MKQNDGTLNAFAISRCDIQKLQQKLDVSPIPDESIVYEWCGCTGMD